MWLGIISLRGRGGVEWQEADTQRLSLTFEREEVLVGTQSEDAGGNMGMGALERTAFWGWRGDHLA